jgi:CheY-like chemotaxis protein
LTRLASELTLAEQKERRRLAAVLHDHLQQLLVGAKYGLEILVRQLDPKPAESVQQVADLLTESIHEARSLTTDLSPPILYEGGLEPALKWLARSMYDKYGLEVDFESDGKVQAEREDVRVLVFQSVREGLFNVVKHAKIMRARVLLQRLDSNHLQVTIADEGVGFELDELNISGTSTSGGFGLFSVRERLRLFGGTMEIHSSKQDGTQLILTVPIECSADGAVPRKRQASGLGELASSGERRKVEGRIRVFLVDDHIVMREGLSNLLSGEPDIEIVGEASNGRDAILLARELRPDVVLMDFSMPGMNGVETTRILHSELPETRIIGLSMYDELDQAAAMYKAGAVAYFTKSGRSDALLESIRSGNSRPPLR